MLYVKGPHSCKVSSSMFSLEEPRVGGNGGFARPNCVFYHREKQCLHQRRSGFHRGCFHDQTCRGSYSPGHSIYMKQSPGEHFFSQANHLIPQEWESAFFVIPWVELDFPYSHSITWVLLMWCGGQVKGLFPPYRGRRKADTGQAVEPLSVGPLKVIFIPVSNVDPATCSEFFLCIKMSHHLDNQQI